MKKTFIFLCSSLFIFFSSACNASSNLTSSVSEITTTKSHNTITDEEAREIVVNKIGDDNGNRIIEIDGNKIEDNGKFYYKIHAYSLSPTMIGWDENGNTHPYQQTFTYGWFYVDTIDGTIYIEETITDNNGNTQVNLIEYQ